MTLVSSLFGWLYWLSVGLFYVVLGVFVAFRPQLLYIKLGKLTTLLIGGVWLAGTAYRTIAVWNGWYKDVLWAINIVGVLFFWFVYDLVGSSLAKFDKVCGAAFFVYCVHPHVYAYLGAVLKRIPGALDVSGVSAIVPPALNVCIAVAGYVMMKRFAPCVQRALCGGR